MHPPFAFRGCLPPSKSLLIRHLLLTLYEPRIEIPILSACHDVVVMQRTCAGLRSAAEVSTPREVQCGEAGLVLRLLLGYAARRGGDYRFIGAPRLFDRPHGPLLSALRALGARIDSESTPRGPALRLSSSGFVEPAAPLAFLGALSSQFQSSLILNAWGLPFALCLRCDAEPVSQGYLDMSIDVARRFGMTVEIEPRGAETWLRIPPEQRPQPGTCSAEADLSSAFAVAAVAAVAGRAEIENFPAHSLQPDRAFVELLQAMSVPCELGDFGLRVGTSAALRPLEADLGGSPDLFPVLAVLCALADGRSRLYGAPQLRGKESDRVATTATLLGALRRRVIPHDDGMEIFGQPISEADRRQPAAFDAGSDHRLVMAAAVAARAGFPLAVSGVAAVAKSFPEFLSIIGINLTNP